MEEGATGTNSDSSSGLHSELHAVYGIRRDIGRVLADLEQYRAQSVGLLGGQCEFTHVKTKLQEAKMWCDKACGEFGGVLPEGYPHDHAE